MEMTEVLFAVEANVLEEVTTEVMGVGCEDGSMAMIGLGGGEEG